MSKKVLVVGTGTIGEPLIGLLSDFREDLGIDEVLFYKRTPLVDEIAKVNSMISRGAKLVAKDIHTASKFNELGNTVSTLFQDALNESCVVVDCTPAGNQNKDDYYRYAAEAPNTFFIAQGSEKGFGLPYAYKINDEALDDDVQFVQVVSCNTHNMACLIDTLETLAPVRDGDFVCLRRANDVSQDKGFVPSTTVGKHASGVHGTHHAQDVKDLMSTLKKKYDIFSSALKVNTQYMHAMRFNIVLQGNVTRDMVIEALEKNPMIALTHKTSANKIFSFGRDHGYYGRIFNQAVIPIETISVCPKFGGITRVAGFSFTPQDGNSLLSSIAATACGVHGSAYQEKLSFVDDLLFPRI